MSQFIQLHLLTSYPPSNLNRDDLGRPKTAKMGGVERLRVSSQSLKRSWRTSNIFEEALSGHVGVRTKRFGYKIFDTLVAGGVKENDAKKWAAEITKVFGKNNKDKPLEIEQLVHLSQTEQDGAIELAKKLAEENREPTKEELDLLSKEKTSVDISLFGRMLASSPAFNIEAACQVAHAISVHPVTVENDYFTAVDDLNSEEESGSAHIGETGFASAVFYLNICINKTQLVDNLGDEDLANKAVAALIEAAVKVSPKGKQNSYASHAYASYALVEKGEQQPRSLAVSFLKPVESEDVANDAVAALTDQVQKIDQVYGACAEGRYSFNALTGEGSLLELIDFACQ